MIIVTFQLCQNVALRVWSHANNALMVRGNLSEVAFRVLNPRDPFEYGLALINFRFINSPSLEVDTSHYSSHAPIEKHETVAHHQEYKHAKGNSIVFIKHTILESCIAQLITSVLIVNKVAIDLPD
jgi:hypothetical protein